MSFIFPAPDISLAERCAGSRCPADLTPTGSV